MCASQKVVENEAFQGKMAQTPSISKHKCHKCGVLFIFFHYVWLFEAFQEVDLEDYVSRPEKISCADIAAICQEAGTASNYGDSFSESATARHASGPTQSLRDFAQGLRSWLEGSCNLVMLRIVTSVMTLARGVMARKGLVGRGSCVANARGQEEGPGFRLLWLLRAPYHRPPLSFVA